MACAPWLKKTVRYAADRARNHIVRMRTSALYLSGQLGGGGGGQHSTDTEVEDGIARLTALRGYLQACKWGRDNNDGPLPTQSMMISEWIATLAPSLFTTAAWRHARDHIVGFEGWQNRNHLHVTVMRRRGGKTEGVKRGTACAALVAMPDEIINLYAQNAEQSRAILKGISETIRQLEPDIEFVYDSNDHVRIRRADGTCVSIIAHSGKAGRGMNGRINIIDEAFYIPLKHIFNSMLQNSAVEGVCFIMISSNADTSTAASLQNARMADGSMACRVLHFREVCVVCEREGRFEGRCRHITTMAPRHISKRRNDQLAAIGHAAGQDRAFALEALNVANVKVNAVLPFESVQAVFRPATVAVMEKLVDVRHIIVGIDPWGGTERSSLGIVTAVPQVADVPGDPNCVVGLIVVGVEDVGYTYSDPQSMFNHVVEHIRAVRAMCPAFGRAQVDVIMESAPATMAQGIAVAVSALANVVVWSSREDGSKPGIDPNNAVKVGIIHALQTHVINRTIVFMDHFVSISDTQRTHGMLNAQSVLMAQMCTLEPDLTPGGKMTYGGKRGAGRDDMVCALAFACRFAHPINEGTMEGLLFPYRFSMPGFSMVRREQDAKMAAVLARCGAVQVLQCEGVSAEGDGGGAGQKRPRDAGDVDEWGV